MTGALIVLSVTVFGILVVLFTEPSYDCGQADCEQRDNPYHSHDTSRRRR